MCYFLLFESSYKISNILYPLMQREKFYFTLNTVFIFITFVLPNKHTEKSEITP